MIEQISLFDGNNEFKIDKPIRLIELFGGIGSQAKALENLGADFEHYRLCEFDKYAVASYNAVHHTDFVISDITKINASDLGIVDTDKYEYIMTYSFPCQDLSNAGLGKGMDKGSGTRSGLLWEVERLLNECNELPQVLVMENVAQVHCKKNMPNFSSWVKFLESKGYKNYWKDLNAKDYGIPQNRNRCFMVSVLGDFKYTFPKGKKLELFLKDLLEENVDEKYYLSDIILKYLVKDDKRVLVKNGTKQGYLEAHVGDCIDLAFPSSKNRRGRVQRGMTQTLTITDTLAVMVYDEQNQKIHTDGICNTLQTDGSSPKHNPRIIKDYRIRKLSPRETWRLMGFSDTDFDNAAAHNSNAQLYKQAGNSICVPVLESIFKNMIQHSI